MRPALGPALPYHHRYQGGNAGVENWAHRAARPEPLTARASAPTPRRGRTARQSTPTAWPTALPAAHAHACYFRLLPRLNPTQRERGRVGRSAMRRCAARRSASLGPRPRSRGVGVTAPRVPHAAAALPSTGLPEGLLEHWDPHESRSREQTQPLPWPPLLEEPLEGLKGKGQCPQFQQKRKRNSPNQVGAASVAPFLFMPV